MRGTTERQQAVLNQVTVKARELIEDSIRAQLANRETWMSKAKEAAVLAGITVFGKELLRRLPDSGCPSRVWPRDSTRYVGGARAVLKARAAYLSGQWDDFWQNRPFQPRAYRRRSAQATRLAA